MQKEIMVGQIPIIIRERNDEISGQNVINPPNKASIEQGNTNPAAAYNILAVSRENYNINEIGNTNPQAAAHNILAVPRDDENGNEVNSAGQNSRPESSSRKRKHHYRHTKSQIEAMEEFFNECPHPDDSQRKELARKLGLDPIQVKFWFQNRRTHVKTNNERKNNNELRAENEKLAAENLCCKNALSNFPCHKCGASSIVPQLPIGLQQLRLENKRLIEQVERVKRLTSEYVDKSLLESYLSSNASASTSTSTSTSNNISQTVATKSGNMVCEAYIAYLKLFVESNAPLVKEVVTASMEELIKKMEAGGNLWIPNGGGSGYVLNLEEYFKAFPTGFCRNGSNWRNEGSMQSAFVMASPLQVVEVFMDMSISLVVYPDFISKATNIYKLPKTQREETKDGDLQLISMEFLVPCPAIPSRESIFMRYCKQLNQQIWVIVDVSLDSILPKLPSDPSIKCLRWPSGCIIQEMPNGLSKVTWVEHVVVNNEVVHQLVEPVLRSGVVYGALRWMSTLERQCHRIAYTLVETNRDNMGGIVDGQGESSMSVLKLSERMCREYFGGATSSDAYGWTYISGDGVDDVRIMKKNNVKDTRIPFGVILSASLCVQLPIPPDIVFDFIRNTTTRLEWDALCNGGEIVQETFRFATGLEGNGVSVLRVHGREDRPNVLILQETSTELTSSSIIYAPLEMDSMMKLLSDDAHLDEIGILPSGFTIIPTKLLGSAFIEGYPEATPLVGTFLTASFQIMISPRPCENISDQSIEFGKSIVKNTLQAINNALIARIG